MNQSIPIPRYQNWDEEGIQSIMFDSAVGRTDWCEVSIEKLSRLSDRKEIEGGEQALAIF